MASLSLIEGDPGLLAPAGGRQLRAESGAPQVLILCENESVPSDRRVWAISRALRDAGCDVVVVCPQGDDAQRAGEERQRCQLLEGIEIRRFPLRFASGGVAGYAGEYAQALTRMGREIARLCRGRRFDVVHVCSPPDFMWLAAWPAVRRGARLVFDHHDLTPELFETRFGEGHRLLHRLTLAVEGVSLRACDVVLATNESYRRVATGRAGQAADRVFVVRNGPDLRRFRPAEPDLALRRGQPHLLAYVGVMEPQDGVDHALHALAQLATRRTDWHAVFAGEGSATPELRSLVTALGLDEQVEFAGWLGDDEITRLLSTADICLSPEPRNALNDVSTMVKIAEYLAMGRPVVAFDLQESRLSAGEAAVYAQPNLVASFADRIDELLSDPAARARMGAAGLRRARRQLCWEQSEQQLLRAYEVTLGLGRRPRLRGSGKGGST